MCDRKGVIYQGRDEGMNQWKSAHAVDTDARTLTEALVGADVFLGLSAAGALKPEMVKDMAPAPIIFAMANPDPEITPAESPRPRAPTRSSPPAGRTIRTRSTTCSASRSSSAARSTCARRRSTTQMKIAAANALAELAREQVPEEVAAAYGVQHSFGPDYIIPAPFDPRLMEVVPAAVAKAAMDSGVATKPILDMAAYRQSLRARLNPTTSVLSLAYEGARAHPKRVLFAEGEEEVVLRAAIAFKEGGYGTPVLVGRDDVPRPAARAGRRRPGRATSCTTAATRRWCREMVDFLYERLQRRGYLRRDVERMVNQDRNIFGALLLQLGEADAMITGVTRTYAQTMREVRRVIDPEAGRTPFGIHVLVGQSHTVFMADTTVNERPTAEELADIAEQTAAVARRMGHEPRVAFLSYSTFGNPEGRWLENLRGAVKRARRAPGRLRI